MGRRGGFVLIGLGTFLIVMAAMMKWYMYPRLAVVPLDQASVSHAVGKDVTYFDVGTRSEKTADLTTTIHVVGDVRASEDQGHNTAVWDKATYTSLPDGTIISTDTMRGAFDRTTGAAVRCCNTNLDGKPVTMSGQLFKMPFNAQKTDYPYFDTDLQAAVDFHYDGTEKIDGLTTYRYVQDIPPTQIGVKSVPSKVVGEAPGRMVEAEVWTSNHRVYWAEPETGVLMQVNENPDTTLRYKGQDVVTATKGSLAFPPNEVAANVKEYGKKGSQLHLIRVTGPLGGLILGLVLLALGVLLGMRRAQQEEKDAKPATRAGVQLSKS